jgi:hypothetical protein
MLDVIIRVKIKPNAVISGEWRLVADLALTIFSCQDGVPEPKKRRNGKENAAVTIKKTGSKANDFEVGHSFKARIQPGRSELVQSPRKNHLTRKPRASSRLELTLTDLARSPSPKRYLTDWKVQDIRTPADLKCDKAHKSPASPETDYSNPEMDDLILSLPLSDPDRYLNDSIREYPVAPESSTCSTSVLSPRPIPKRHISGEGGSILKRFRLSRPCDRKLSPQEAMQEIPSRHVLASAAESNTGTSYDDDLSSVLDLSYYDVLPAAPILPGLETTSGWDDTSKDLQIPTSLASSTLIDTTPDEGFNSETTVENPYDAFESWLLSGSITIV